MLAGWRPVFCAILPRQRMPCPGQWWNGRHKRLKIVCGVSRVRVRVPPALPDFSVRPRGSSPDSPSPHHSRRRITMPNSATLLPSARITSRVVSGQAIIHSAIGPRALPHTRAPVTVAGRSSLAYGGFRVIVARRAVDLAPRLGHARPSVPRSPMTPRQRGQTPMLPSLRNKARTHNNRRAPQCRVAASE
jgi:hypothetical protein